jgi:hypothetical protein
MSTRAQLEKDTHLEERRFRCKLRWLSKSARSASIATKGKKREIPRA